MCSGSQRSERGENVKMITRAVQSLTLSRFLLALAALSCTWTMSCLLSPVSCLLANNSHTGIMQLRRGVNCLGLMSLKNFKIFQHLFSYFKVFKGLTALAQFLMIGLPVILFWFATFLSSPPIGRGKTEHVMLVRVLVCVSGNLITYLH